TSGRDAIQRAVTKSVAGIVSRRSSSISAWSYPSPPGPPHASNVSAILGPSPASRVATSSRFDPQRRGDLPSCAAITARRSRGGAGAAGVVAGSTATASGDPIEVAGSTAGAPGAGAGGADGVVGGASGSRPGASRAAGPALGPHDRRSAA